MYVTQFDVVNKESFKQELQEKHNISAVLSAKWTTSRNQNSKAFLLTFDQTKIPEYITMPEKQPRVRVYGYYRVRVYE